MKAKKVSDFSFRKIIKEELEPVKSELNLIKANTRLADSQIVRVTGKIDSLETMVSKDSLMLKEISKNIKVIVNFFDKEHLKLRRRIKRVEERD
ncbi:MAG: hypothetical protein ABIB61_01870 [Candidatus Shapirobacteria bacterium]